MSVYVRSYEEYIKWDKTFITDEDQANADGEVTWNVGLYEVPASVGLGVREPPPWHRSVASTACASSA
jgi:hypothetical protein